MTILILDVETSYQIKDGKKNPSPYLPENKLVSVGLGEYSGRIYNHNYYFFHHSFLDNVSLEKVNENFRQVQDALDRAALLVGHNLKFDLNWLRCCGFKLPNVPLFDTMLVKYILNRGIKKSLSLENVAIECGIQPKKSHLIDQYMKDNVSFENIPMEIVEEYGLGDVDTTFALYEYLNKELEDSPTLLPTVKMSHEFLKVIMEMEFNGVKIDEAALNKVDQEYKEELDGLVEYFNTVIPRFMGDTPINLDSPKQMSIFVYSREVTDFGVWQSTFNTGIDERGKQKRRPKLTQQEFIKAVKDNTTLARKTNLVVCDECNGYGIYYKYKRDGSLSKRTPRCKKCQGSGVMYQPTKEIAGLKLSPKNIDYISASGFATDKELLEELAETASGEAKEFLKNYSRYNAITTYRDTFVEGIRKALINGFIHTNIHQTVVLTGRLSSSSPSLLNQPRGGTFPVRRAFVSRFPGGKIGKGDYKQLEFRCAVFQAQDQEGIDGIIEGTDIHADTARVIGCSRQEAKAHSFKPLYGGLSGTEAQQKYYQWFLNEKYTGIKRWHQDLLKEAVSTKKIVLPTGREYAFPFARFNRYGGISGGTKVKNYPVQGFATADIVPCSSILVMAYYNQYNLQSKVILEVHDENVVDLHPDEIEIGMELLGLGMLNAQYDIFERYGIRLNLPLEIELAVGDNWLEVKPWHMKS